MLLPYVHKWLEENQGKPTHRKVADKLSEYRGTERLERYYRRALMSPEERSIASAASSARSLAEREQNAQLASQLAKEKAKRLEEQQQKEKALQETKAREEEAKLSEEKQQQQQKQLQQQQKQLEEAANAAAQMKRQLQETAKKSMDERHQLEREALRLKNDLEEQKKIAQRVMFPEADDIVISNSITDALGTPDNPLSGIVTSTNCSIKQKISVTAPLFQPAGTNSSTQVTYSHPLSQPYVVNQQPFVKIQPHFSGNNLKRGNIGAITDSMDDLRLARDQSSYTQLPSTMKKTGEKKPSISSPIPGMEWYDDPKSAKPDVSNLMSSSTPGVGGYPVDGYLHARYTAAFEEMGRVQEKNSRESLIIILYIGTSWCKNTPSLQRHRLTCC